MHVPLPHELPHAPQLAGSLPVLVHRPLQVEKPVGQLCVHVPLLQLWPAAQVLPQAPQLAGSLAVLRHTPLHDC